ncbi:MAG: DNA methyltransferase [Candidatus Magasanikbacteria bacterium]
MPKFNDIDLDNWKSSEIWTDSLWLISERDKTGKHSNFYHGNFVPQIPRQLILRYTKKNDIIFDPFIGSGTTAFEAETLGRNCVGVDIQSKLIGLVRGKIDSKKNFFEFISGDSVKEKTFDSIKETLQKHRRQVVQLAILHPPYADIVKFSDKKEDLSNAVSLKDFLDKFAKVVKNTLSILEHGRYIVVVIGDKYSQGRWIPLNFYCINEMMKLGLVLKSIVIKNMEGNRAKLNKEAIWRYRALSSDYYIFKHEYILIFKY